MTGEHKKGKTGGKGEKQMKREEKGPWALVALLHVTIVHPLPTLKDRSGLGCITEINEFFTPWKWWCPSSPFAGGKTEKL